MFWQSLKKLLCSLLGCEQGSQEPEFDFQLDIMPRSAKEITATELKALLRDRFPRAEITLSNVKLGDPKFKLCHYDDIAVFLAQDDTNKMGYVAQETDCDDFAFRLKGQFSVPNWSGLCLGIIWTERHALNFCVDEEKRIWFIEPQLDELSLTLAPWQGGTPQWIAV